jgi:hypothetical protein
VMRYTVTDAFADCFASDVPAAMRQSAAS